MSLFDEFDKLSFKAERKGPDHSNLLPEPESNREIYSARPKAPETSAIPSPDSQELTNTTLSQTEYSPKGPVGFFRFSLSRGGIVASIAGTLVAAASLFIGGYVTAYVVYNPKGSDNLVITKIEPSPEFKKNNHLDQSEELEGLKGTHRSLEVVMSSETSGGKAVVAPKIREDEMRQSVGRTFTYPQSFGEKDTNHSSNSENLQKKSGKELISQIPGSREKSIGFIAPKRKLERLLTSPSSDDGFSDTNLRSEPPKNQKKNRTTGKNGKRLVSDEKGTDVIGAAPSNRQDVPFKVSYSGDFGYSLQLAAFSSKINASQMMKKLEGFVPTARIDKGRGRSGQVLYFLRVGYVEKRADAIIMANRLSAEKKIKSGYIMRVRSPDVVQ